MQDSRDLHRVGSIPWKAEHHAKRWRIYGKTIPTRAFEWLERAYMRRDTYLSFSQRFWPLRKIKTDPRYAALLKKLNLPRD